MTAENRSPKSAGIARQIVLLVRSAGRRVIDLPDRLWHARRRARVESFLRARPAVASVLFVCHGNICRSPYAAARLRAILNEAGIDHVAVDSAALIGPAGRGSPAEAIAAARTRQIDLRSHRSAIFDTTRPHDVVMAMERWQADDLRQRIGADARTSIILLGELDPLPFRIQAVRDPYGHPPASYSACFERIDRCVSALAALIVERRGTRPPRSRKRTVTRTHQA